MIQSEKYTCATKHTNIKFHFIKNLRETGIIDFVYCPSKLMTADVLSKLVPRSDRQKHTLNLMLYPHHSSENKGKYYSLNNLLIEMKTKYEPNPLCRYIEESADTMDDYDYGRAENKLYFEPV